MQPSQHRLAPPLASPPTPPPESLQRPGRYVVSCDPQLLGPYQHVSCLQSKNVRAKFVDAFNCWLGVHPALAAEVKDIVGMLHNASLLMDDVEDGAVLRRGLPAAHLIYGVPMTLNCANHVYFIALARLLELPRKLVSVLTGTEGTPPTTTPVVLSPCRCTTCDDDGSAGEAHDPPPPPQREATGSPQQLPPPKHVFAGCGEALGEQEDAKGPELLDDCISGEDIGSHGKAAGAAVAELMHAFTSEMQELHVGQGLDIHWRDSTQCPTLAQYRGMVEQKTGGLFRLALRMLLGLAHLQRRVVVGSVATAAVPVALRPLLENALYLSSLTAQVEDHMIRLVNHFAYYFQVLDDYLNLRSELYHKNKSYCEDLTEGKFSFPVIHSILSAGQQGDVRLLTALRQRPTEAAVKQYCVSLIEATGSFAFCDEVLSQTAARIESMIGHPILGPSGNAMLLQCLQSLVALKSSATV